MKKFLLIYVLFAGISFATDYETQTGMCNEAPSTKGKYTVFYYYPSEAKKVHERKSCFNGKANGLWSIYLPDGTLYYTGTLKNGIKHGVFKSYYENGQIEDERTWVNGKDVPPRKSWYKSGALEFELKSMNGVSTWYYENGQVKAEYHIKNGVGSGPAKGYYPDGTLQWEAKYKNGELDGYKRCTNGKFGNEDLECD